MGENKENGIFKTLACNSVVEKGALAMAQAIGIAPNERLLYYSSLACAASFPNDALRRTTLVLIHGAVITVVYSAFRLLYCKDVGPFCSVSLDSLVMNRTADTRLARYVGVQDRKRADQDMCQEVI